MLKEEGFVTMATHFSMIRFWMCDNITCWRRWLNNNWCQEF